MSQQRLLEEWNKFARALKLENASEVQRREMRRAFYAGAWAIMNRLSQDVSQGDEQTPEDDRLLEDFQNECRKFNQDVMEGRA